MWKEIVLMMFVLGLVSFSVGYFYSQTGGEPISLKPIITRSNPPDDVIIDIGPTPVFAPNMRFNHNLISYYFEPNCLDDKKEKMLEAFAIFHDEMEIISFYEKQSDDADILISCSKENIEAGHDMFIAGEGGPSKFVNGSLFNVILEGQITLYKESDCDYPVVELHELLHVFGFNHINNVDSLMYNISRCNQRISGDMMDTINTLYSISPKPDIFISDVSAVKKRRYLDFNITIENRGLIDVEEEVLLIISSEGKKIKEFLMGNLSIFSARTLMVQNVKLNSRSDEKIEFRVVAGATDEMDFENNVVEMIVSY